MIKDKEKNLELISRKQFLVGWTISYASIFFLPIPISSYMAYVFSQFYSTIMPQEIIFLVITIFIAIVAYFQQQIINRFWGINITHWWWLTAISNGLITLLLNIIWGFITEPYWIIDNLNTVILFNNLIQFGLVGIIQGLLLRKYLKHIWLYVFAFIFIGYFSNYMTGYFDGSLYIATYWIFLSTLSGLVFLWLDHVTYEEDQGISISNGALEDTLAT